MEAGPRPGAAHIARKFDLPIILAYIEGCDSWRKGQPSSVRFGPSFPCEGLTKSEINRAIQEQMRELSLRSDPDVTLPLLAK